ncbi:MAG: transcription elongation factor GreA, partial [Treponema sp.]|nr:transcription elongation factor GreA [Treponema sp.]
REDMIKKIKNDKAWTLKTIIRSFDNSCDFKRIKAELVPAILTPGEWTSWNSAAKKILESDSQFGVNPNNINEYIVREHKITPEEKLSNEFKAQKQFFARVDILMRYANDEMTDKESDLFADMFSYFTGFLKAINVVNEQVVASYLVVQKISTMPEFASFATQPSFNFAQMYNEIENPREMYTLLKDTKNTSLRKDFLEGIKKMPGKGVEQYINLFPTVLDGQMLTYLIENGFTSEVQKLAVDSFNDFRGHRDAILYFFENSENEAWFKEAAIDFQKQLIAILNIISQAYREIENHVDTTENRKVIKKAEDLLFKHDTLINFMLKSDKNTLAHLYTLADDIPGLDGAKKAQLRNKILEKYPDYKFHKTEEKSTAPKGMVVTAKMLKVKQDLEKDMQTVQIPAIAKEVAEAKEKGDLKENAEYIAAREAQHKLQNDLKRLEGELARAVVFDPTTATMSYVSFGTDVTLVNKETGKEETYTILGPWESNPENGIISYMSPFGNAVIDHKVGDDLSFTINEHKYSYTVKSIKLAQM